MRKFLCVLCAVAITISLCSCGVRNQENAHSNGTNQNGTNYVQEDNAVNGANSNTGASSANGLQIICDGNVRQYGCNTEDGYYYITGEVTRLKDDSFAYHLMYVDFATQQEIYLCSNSGCQHDTESCTAVLPTDDFRSDSRMFVYKDAVYILSREYDNDGNSFSMMGSGTSSIEGSSSVLYRMGLDGGNRSKVFTFDSDLTLEPSVLADDSGIYLITKKLESVQNSGSTFVTSTDRQIVKLDTSSWKLETVCDMGFGYDNTTWKIIGGYDHSVVLEGIVFDKPGFNEQQVSEGEYLEAYRNSKSVFGTLELETGKFSEIHSVTNKALHSSAAQDGMLYLSLNTEDTIHRIDLRTGEKSVLAALGQNNIYQAFDGMLCTTSWELTDDYGMNFVDMESGEISRCNLTTKTLGWRLELRGETADKMLVVYDYDAVESSLAQNENAYEINRYKLALIDKDDLYHGNDNFQPIQMVGKGL